MHVFSFCWLVFPFREWNKCTWKTSTVIVLYLQLLNTKIYRFHNLSLGFILKICLKFCEFQPWYSYKIYSDRKKKGVASEVMLINGLNLHGNKKYIKYKFALKGEQDCFKWPGDYYKEKVWHLVTSRTLLYSVESKMKKKKKKN